MLKDYILKRWIVNKVKMQLPVIPSEIVREHGCTYCPYYAGRMDRQSKCMLKRCSWDNPEEYHPAMKQLIPFYESKMEKAKSKYKNIKALMTNYQKLILENQMVLEDLEEECQEKINEDMAYALNYLDIYSHSLDVSKLYREMNNLMIIYGLSDLIYRGITLVKFYAPNGIVLEEILRSCFCCHYDKTDIEVQQELGIGRTNFYKQKKLALKYLGFYFYEIVLPQAKHRRFKPSLGVEEE